MIRVASVDVGTNTIRLLIAEKGAGLKDLRKIVIKRDITRLGEDFIKNREISPKAIRRSVSVLENYRDLLDEYNVTRTVAVATSAVRDAVNRSEFLKEVYQNTGLEIQVISEQEEARITSIGVLSAIDDVVDGTVVVDIGGGSTEFIIIEGNAPAAVHSLDLGVVYLTERFVHSDPPNPLELKNLGEFVDERLSSMLKFSLEPRIAPPFSLVGTAGTITTLAAIDQEMETYNPDRINKHVLTRESVKDIYERLNSVTLVERRSIPGLERGREDIILAGTVIVLKIMEIFSSDQMMVSDYGLLEGIIIDGCAKAGMPA
ncbi:MAG: Ppx/GppA phosphatase family protein [Pseudomonadota bacterium]